MVFVFPLFLWALAAVTVPVIIHLFNFRRYKKIYFTNVKFLKELQQESKSKSRLREILILITRCLAIVCLVLAFCQPVIPSRKNNNLYPGANAISLYIDNSFSMGNVNKQGPLLELAKTRTKEVVKTFGGMDKFQVITNDFEGKHQRFHSKEDALSAIEDIKISSSVRRLSDVLKRQQEFLNTSGLDNKKIYVFSDAQKSTFNIKDIIEDTTIKTTLIPFKTNQINNIYIDSCWFESPLQQKGFIQTLHVSLLNNGNSSVDVASAKLFLNKQQIAISSYSLAASSRGDIQFTFECKQPGFNFGSIKIEDFPITFDDELFFAFNAQINLSVTLINGKKETPSNSFTSLFGSDRLFVLKTLSEQTIDYSAFKTSDVIVLNQLSELSSGLVSELLKFTEKGGSLVIIPSEQADPASYSAALGAFNLPLLGVSDSSSLKTENAEAASKFYAGVFEKTQDRVNLPLVNHHFKLMKGAKNDFDGILRLQNGDIFVGSSRLNAASVFLFSAPLNVGSTNFNKHALFVPTFYQICFQSIKAAPLFYPVSSNVVINLRNDATLPEQPPHIKQLGGDWDIIPEMRVVNNSLFLYTRHQIRDPGFYNVVRNTLPLLPLAFNFSRTESDLNAYSAEALAGILIAKGFKAMSLIEDAQSDISAQILKDLEGKKLWKLFIILALIFLLIEVALLRFLK